MSLLEVEALEVRFRAGGLGRARETIRAVNGVSFKLDAGETIGLVGESGCGKTTLGRAVLRLLEPSAGTVWFDGRNLTQLPAGQLRPLRREMQMVFQDPYGSLNPRLTAEEILAEPLDIHRLARDRAARRARVVSLLADVGLEPAMAGRYPHEFSGGQRQRLGIARALAVEPKLVVCDEPVSALDVSVQAQIINLLHDLQQEHRLAYLFIAHDLAVVEHLSRRVLVMYLGRIVEAGPATEVCRAPLHPYTQALVSAVPRVTPDRSRRRIVLGGDVPSPLHLPTGCPFHPRCPVAEARCRTEAPSLTEVTPGHAAACLLLTSSCR